MFLLPVIKLIALYNIKMLQKNLYLPSKALYRSQITYRNHPQFHEATVQIFGLGVPLFQ